MKAAMKQDEGAELRSGKWHHVLGPIAALIAFTFFESHIIDLIQRTVLNGNAAVALEIALRTPPWKVYQNRLLGPELAYICCTVCHLPFKEAYQRVAWTLLCVSNLVTFFVVRRYSRQDHFAWAFVFAKAFFFLSLQDRSWLYLWDYVDLTTMTLFAAGMFEGFSEVTWLALFLIQLLSKEFALFIPVWIILDSVFETDRGKFRANYGRAVFGLILLVAGELWTGWIRNVLCLGERLNGDSVPGVLLGEHYKWNLNISDLAHPFYFYDGAVYIIQVALVIGGYVCLKQFPGLFRLKVAAIAVIVLASFYVTAILTELRVWQMLIPFALWMVLSSMWRRSPEAVGASTTQSATTVSPIS